MTTRSPQAGQRLIEYLGEEDDMSLTDAEDLMGETDCPEGCVVEADGLCSHGYLSAGRTAGMI